MNPIICPVFRYDDASTALAWLARALGFEVRSDHRTPDGLVAHADLRLGSSAIGVSSTNASKPDSPWAQVRQGIYVVVDDPDAFHARAVAAGAEIVIPLTDMDYGSREFSLRDPGGHLWGLGTYDMGATDGEPALWPEARYDDAAAAVEWLERALGFRKTFDVKTPQGTLMHAELRLGRAVLMIAPGSGSGEWVDLRQFTNVHVDDVDAHFARAKAAGATVVREPHTTGYGARVYAARDAEGFLWWVSDYAPST